MTWIFENWDKFLEASGVHLRLAVIPVLLGLVVAIPLGWLANRSRSASAVLMPLSNVLYTVPSLAMIVIMPVLLGSKILDEINIIVALTIYTVALLIRNIADGLHSVPGHVVAAANAMGFRPLRRFLTVELPLAVPVTIAGLRVAMVSNISMVSIGALIGLGGYGQLFIQGFQSNEDIIWAGLIGTLVLAFIGDVLLQLAGRVLTPWVRAGR
ncbi:glycine/betaine ABC transporter permease [Lentzea sp. NBRC 105346]|uniref:ABC transporter permease n=1 Tax=Lentzea sp. NBRC 105346 TaxID=3032205 RepID=UPI0024A01E6F|nr:ABC transporter permease [Lentzea sp. NBRC 105346]GLZ29894.1 glycine/betaine ABC transporter permease [Lentzea sp. NBRC 105346]